MKKTVFASESQSLEVQGKREEYLKAYGKKPSTKMIFIDESGFHLGMSRHYGRSLSHERVKSFAPFNKGKRVTMIGAIGLEEVKTGLYGQWHVDGQIFVSFIKECLVPVLKPGQIVVMDNLSTHKVKGVKELIEEKGAKLVYLPAYSPDLNPIELFWSKMKAYIRKKEARCFKSLEKAIKQAYHSITASDLQGWFKHCGYCVQ